GATLTKDAEFLIRHKQSLLIDTRTMPAGRHEVFVTDPGFVPLRNYQRFEVTVTYRVIDPGPIAANSEIDYPFEIGIRPAAGGESIGNHRYWTAPKGYTATRVMQVSESKEDTNVFYIATRKPSAIVIDQVSITLLGE
ncbi:MAG: hypothetical protein FWC56_04265, partial [Phycisphaerae bacterium]|nr:hypothetical protein [Phycisphaerae bacterium]